MSKKPQKKLTPPRASQPVWDTKTGDTSIVTRYFPPVPGAWDGFEIRAYRQGIDLGLCRRAPTFRDALQTHQAAIDAVRRGQSVTGIGGNNLNLDGVGV